MDPGSLCCLIGKVVYERQLVDDEDKTVEAEKYCEKIIDGEYGFYDIDNRWDCAV